MGGFFKGPDIPVAPKTPTEPIVDENRIKQDEEARLASKRGRKMNILVGNYIKRKNSLGSSSTLGD